MTREVGLKQEPIEISKLFKTLVIRWADTGPGVFYTQTMECVRMEVGSGQYMEAQPVFQTQGQPYSF